MKIFAITMAMGCLAIGGSFAVAADKAPATCGEVQTCGTPDCCGRCGRHGACQKYCRIVCEMKEVKKTVWVVKCEEFCTMMPGCGRDCNGCGSCGDCRADEPCGCESRDKGCDPCAAEKNKCFVPPKCGKTRVRKTLEKKEIVCKVPSYKCVVVHACGDCGASGACGVPQMTGEKTAPAAPSPPPAPMPGKTTLRIQSELGLDAVQTR